MPATSESLAKQYVNKAAAAQRQIDAAIRMLLRNEDKLAIHTVAAAAYTIIRDLKRHRGRSELADSYKDSVFYIARDYANGRIKHLPAELDSAPKIRDLILQIAQGISEGTISQSGDGLEVSVDHVSEKNQWTAYNKPANFLKHADYDPNAMLNLDRIDAEALILQAVNSYFDLMGGIGQFTPEMHVFCIYGAANQGYLGGLDGARKKIAESLMSLDEDDQREACLDMIAELKAASAS